MIILGAEQRRQGRAQNFRPRELDLLFRRGRSWRLGRSRRRRLGRRRFGGHSDLLQASDLLEYISTSVQQFDARLRVAYVGAHDLIEDNWPSVQAVAEELLRKKTLTADEVASLVLPRLLAA
jgi:hypothetical protein